MAGLSRLRRGVGLLVALMGMGLALPAVAQTDATATITVIHAVPGEGGFPADILLGGEVVISAMAFEGLAGPTEVNAGDVMLEVFPAGADTATTEPVLAQTLDLEAGANYTLVAQMIGDAPAVSLYFNDVSSVVAGGARLTVRQTSAEAALSFVLDGDVLSEGLQAPSESTVEVDAGGRRLVVATDDGTVLADQDIEVPEGTLVVLYAVGATADASFSLLNQQVEVAQTPPTGVPTGSGGVRSQASAPGWLVVPAMFVGAVVLGFAWARRRPV